MLRRVGRVSWRAKIRVVPTYVYECRECEKVFEKDQRISEDPIKDCDCGAKGSVKRLIQPTAVMFKGSGFYVNDSTGSKPAPKVEEPKTECTGTPSTCACTNTPADSKPTV